LSAVIFEYSLEKEGSSMKKLFPKRGHRVALVAALLAITLVFSAFSFAPSAHAATATNVSPARSNTCLASFPCIVVWGTNVNVRSCHSTSCSIVGTLAGGNESVLAICQAQGGTVNAAGITNNWWMDLEADNGNFGWTTNIYIVGGQTIANVPFC
jgi:hypothetical protein